MPSCQCSWIFREGRSSAKDQHRRSHVHSTRAPVPLRHLQGDQGTPAAACPSTLLTTRAPCLSCAVS